MKNILIVKLLAFFLLISCSTKENETDINFRIVSSSDRVLIGHEFELKIDGTNLNDLAKVSWDFGDKTKQEGLIVSHSYSKPGKYRVSATTTFITGDVEVYIIDIDSFYEEIDEKVRQSLKDRLKDNKVMICGHRGFGKFAPENSMYAFNEAVNKRVDMIEIDIRKSKDGHLVIMHDETINRTTNGEGKVNDLTYDELSTYNLYDGQSLSLEKIPLLSDVLESVRGKIYIDIDAKSDVFKEVYDLVKLYGMLNQVAFTVYDVQSNRQLLGIDKNVIVMPVIYQMQDLTDYLTINNPLHLAQFNSKAFIDDILNVAQERDVAIFKNTYVNTSKTPTSDSYKEVKEFISKQGRLMQTDHPEELRNYFDSL